MKRLAAVSVVLAALTAACGSDDDGGAIEADPGASEVTAEFNEADVAFAQGMIPHHVQAIEMAELASDRAESDEVKDLAARIEAGQGPEIEVMTGWLQSWGEPVEPDGMDGMDGMDHGGMSGMMSDEDMTALADADGADFDRQFLEMMAEHHRGAIEMAEVELDEGESPDALQLAQLIMDTQTEEIVEIEELLAAL